MLNGVSAFSPTGNGLYLGQNYGGYSGVGSGNSIFSGGYGSSSSRVTSRVSSYLRTEYSDTIQKAQEYLSKGEFDKAMDKIESLREHARQYANEIGVSVDEEQVSTILNKAGANFNNYIDENSHGSFMTGILNGIPLVGLLFNSYSEAEIEAKLGNDDVRLKDKIQEGTGKVISGGIGGAATGAAIGALGGPIGAGLGAVIGIGLAFAQTAVKDWVNAQ